MLERLDLGLQMQELQLYFLALIRILADEWLHCLPPLPYPHHPSDQEGICCIT